MKQSALQRVIPAGRMKMMKRKNRTAPIAAAVVILLLIAAAALIFLLPARFNRLEPGKVESVELFSGQTGKGVTVTDAETVDGICEALSGAKLRANGISLGRMGYAIRVTVHESGGGERSFIVNSADTVRRDPFFYEPVSGEIDYDYLVGLIPAE